MDIKKRTKIEVFIVKKSYFLFGILKKMVE